MPAPLNLDAWDNFYVIVGSSAAGLTGLSFVVVALVADAHAVRLTGLRTFITPMVVHFCSTLAISVLLCVPGQTAFSLGICIGLVGLVGLTHNLRVLYFMYRMYRAQGDYTPQAADWSWNGALPTTLYLTLCLAALDATTRPDIVLYVSGGVALGLLFVGIHNAWDMAVWVTAERPSLQKQQEEQKQREGIERSGASGGLPK